MAQSVAELQKKIQDLQADLDARLETVSAQAFPSEKPRLQELRKFMQAQQEFMQPQSVPQIKERLGNIQQQINERLNTVSQGDQQEELYEDVDFKDLIGLFNEGVFGPGGIKGYGEDVQNVGEGLWKVGKRSVMAPLGPGGILKSLVNLLKQVETRRESHFPERYKQRNYDVTLPDESGFQWPNLSPEP